jgi:pilus assembly protein Flp/PilA
MQVSGFKQSQESVMQSVFNRFVKCESGATAIEYGLIAALIGVVMIAAAKATGVALSGTFNKISGNLT